jgi:ribosomal protein S18 acetylase RimI-like enzyme
MKERDDTMGGVGVTVRPARGLDLAVLVDYNLRLARESEGRELDPVTVAAGVGAVLEDNAKGQYFVAETGGRVVGQIMITVEWSDWRNGPVWWLQSVYVDREQRGKGLFAALFRKVAVAARDAGAPLLRLYVEKDNVSAQTVYRRLGMTSTGYRVFELELSRGLERS